MSALAQIVTNYTPEQLTAAKEEYTKLTGWGFKRIDVENSLKGLYRWEPAVVTATLDEIERLNAASAPAQTAVAVEPEIMSTAVVDVQAASATSFFESIALPLVEKLNVPVAPCFPWDYERDGKKMGKTVDLPSPLTMMSKDPAHIREWGRTKKNANVCVYAQQVEGGLCFVDKDGAVSLRSKYESETGKSFPKTLLVRSSIVSDGNGGTVTKGHWYFRQTPRTVTMSNIGEDKTGGLFSFRVNNMYVTSIGSVHPVTGEPYEIVEDYDVLPMPDDFLEWLQSQVVEKPKTREEVVERGKYKLGTRYNALMSELGSLWNRGYDRKGLVEAGLAWARVHFDTGATEFDEALVTKEIEHYADSYGDGQDKSLVLNQQPESMQAAAATDANKLSVSIDTSEGAVRPKFPLWAVQGTSIYENLVKPAVATSSKFEEFIFVPAMQMMLNSLSMNVGIELQPTNLNLFVGLISPYGEFFKSTSCELAHKYFELVGICSEMTKSIKNAEGKTYTFQAGSPEVFGIQMYKTNCRRAILSNDELGKFVSKAGIESSSFCSDLLSWYGSASYGNNVTNGKNNFSFERGTYTFGWLWCTTDRNFNRYWPKLAGMSSGIEDRMFFVVSPEKPKPAGPYSDPDFRAGALKTKELIDKAINQRTYRIEESEAFARRAKGLDPRSFDLLKKLALYFAVDLDIPIIDDDCVERARALVDYRNQAAAYLEPIEADNVEGRLQKEVIRELRQNRGKMSYRDLCRNLDFGRYGIRMWKAAYYGLVSHGDIVEFQEVRTAGKRATRMVGLVKHDEDE